MFQRNNFPDETYLHLTPDVDTKALGTFFSQESKCLFTIADADADADTDVNQASFVDIYDRLTGRIRWRRMFLFLSANQQEFDKFK